MTRFRRPHVAGALLPAVLSLMIAGCQRAGDPALVVTGTTGNSAAGTVIVERGDSPALIAKRYEVPLSDLLAVNSLTNRSVITPGQRLTLPNTRQYVVRRGDTLNGIARMFGLDPMELARSNNLQPPYNVPLGQPLRLPPAGGSEGAQVAAAAPPPSSPKGGTPEEPAPAPVAVSPSAKRGGVETSALPPPTSSPQSTPQPAPPPASSQPPAPDARATPEAKAPPAETRPAAAPLPIGKTQAQRPSPVVPTTDDQPAPAAQPAASDQSPAPAAKPVETKSAEAKPTKPTPEAPAPTDDTPPKGDGQFLMPVKGKLISGYGPKPDGTHNDGLNIAAAKGTSVFAAGDGVVAYAGNELKGFGNLLLIRHSGGWMTAYAHLDQMTVTKGDKVKRGQAIAAVGQTGSVDSPQLHFEVRKGSQPVDPNGHL